MRKSIPENDESELKERQISKLLKKVSESKINSRKSSLKKNKIEELIGGKPEKSTFFMDTADNEQTEN